MQTFDQYKMAADLLAANPEGPWQIGRYQIVKSNREDQKFAPYRVLDEHGGFLTQRRKLSYACQAVGAYQRQDLGDLAPELLGALEKLVGSLVSPNAGDDAIAPLLSSLPGCGDIIPAVLSARKAIAKARGL